MGHLAQVCIPPAMPAPHGHPLRRASKGGFRECCWRFPRPLRLSHQWGPRGENGDFACLKLGVEALLQQLVLVGLGAVPDQRLFIGIKLQVFEFAGAQFRIECSPLQAFGYRAQRNFQPAAVWQVVVGGQRPLSSIAARPARPCHWRCCWRNPGHCQRAQIFRAKPTLLVHRLPAQIHLADRYRSQELAIRIKASYIKV